jgi:hypothetical protein
MNALPLVRLCLTKQLPLWLFLLFVLGACKRSTEGFDTLQPDELLPLAEGKYITYRLDSLVFINSGKLAVTNRYQVRHVVEGKTTDNLNRPTWRISTYYNDSTASGPWVLRGSYFITPLEKRVEVIENNLRVVKIQLPVKEGFTWKGNSFLPDRPYSDIYATSIDENMDLWDFTYETVNQPESIGTLSVPDVTTILHIDESRNVPMTTDTIYASREYSIEKYAKNIGLVYREHVLWENQPRQRTIGTPPNLVTTYDPVRVGFGVKQWMINKN